MRLFVYYNELLDPAKGIGIAKQFANAKDLDAYVQFFVVSIKPNLISNWRMFITNDEVEFHEVDHLVQTDDHYRNANRIKEVDVYQVARECNAAVAAIDKRRSKAKAQLDKYNAQRHAAGEK